MKTTTNSLHKSSRKSQRLTHALVYLFHLTSTFLFSLSLYVRNFEHTFICKHKYTLVRWRESIAHQLHHLIYFTEEKENRPFARSNGRHVAKFTSSNFCCIGKMREQVKENGDSMHVCSSRCEGKCIISIIGTISDRQT